MFITSESTDKLFQALFEFQKECPTIEKKADGGFKGTKYADRTDVIQEIRPILIKNDLFFTQASSSSQTEYIGMTTRIIHVISNQWVQITEHRAAGRIEKGLSQPQADGCVLTYMSRQQLVYLLGIPLVGEDDEKSLSNYQPIQKFQSPYSNLYPSSTTKESFAAYEKGKMLLKNMDILSPRASSIETYCIMKGYSNWEKIPPRSFKEDKDLHEILKLSGLPG